MRSKQGIVTSARMKGTVTVAVHEHAYHPVYRKRFRRSKKFLADANGHELIAGDTVEITECRPLSKRKRFKVAGVIRQAPRVSDVREESGLEKAMHRGKADEEAEQTHSTPDA